MTNKTIIISGEYPHWASFYWVNNVNPEGVAKAQNKCIEDVILAYALLNKFHSTPEGEFTVKTKEWFHNDVNDCKD